MITIIIIIIRRIILIIIVNIVAAMIESHNAGFSACMMSLKVSPEFSAQKDKPGSLQALFAMSKGRFEGCPLKTARLVLLSIVKPWQTVPLLFRPSQILNQMHCFIPATDPQTLHAV